MTQHIHNHDCFVEGTQVCGVTPAEQASKQVPTIDTPEYRKLVRAVWSRASMSNSRLSNEEAALIAHIDAKLAGQPAAPVAATEQAEIFDFFGQERKGLGWGAWFLLHADTEAEGKAKAAEWQGKRKDRQWKMVSRLATPADAGAGRAELAKLQRYMESEGEGGGVWPDVSGKFVKLEDVEALLATSAAPVTASDALVRAAESLRNAKTELDAIQARAAGSNKHVDAANQYQGAIAKLIDAALASQSSAPVTAEPVAQTLYEVLKQVEEELRGRSFSQHRVREGNSDVWRYIGKGEQVAAAVREAVQRYAAPVSPQPAAQVPSRDDVLEEAAKAAEQCYANGGQPDDPHPEAVVHNGAVNDCAFAIRALKVQPAAAHAAKEGGQQ